MSVTDTSYLHETSKRKEPAAICSKDGLADVCDTCGKPFPPLSKDVPPDIAEYLKTIKTCSKCCEQILKKNLKNETD